MHLMIAIGLGNVIYIVPSHLVFLSSRNGNAHGTQLLQRVPYDSTGESISGPDVIAKDEAKAETMRLRADLAIALRDRVVAWKMTQAEAAKRLGISQLRLNDLLKGRIENFRLDMLTRLASGASLKVEMKVRKAA